MDRQIQYKQETQNGDRRTDAVGPGLFYFFIIDDLVNNLLLHNMLIQFFCTLFLFYKCQAASCHPPLCHCVHVRCLPLQDQTGEENLNVPAL